MNAILALSLLLAATGGDGLLRTAAELEAYRRTADFRSGRRFALTGQITARTGGRGLVLTDATGRAFLSSRPPTMPRPGDLVRAEGECVLSDEGYHFTYVDSFERQGFRPPPDPVPATADALASGQLDGCRVRTQGKVTDVFVDEIDNRWYYFVVRDTTANLYATIKKDDVSPDFMSRLADATVSLDAVCLSEGAGKRRYLGSHVIVLSQEDIRILRPAPSDPFDVPAVDFGLENAPSLVRGLGRRKVRGTVIAAWGGNRVILRTADGRRLRADLVDGTPLPACGSCVDVVGTPETDLFRINLTRSAVRPCADAADADDTPCTDLARVMLDDRGRPQIQPEYFGRLIRIDGIVRTLPTPGNGHLIVEVGQFQVPVDVSACPSALDGIALGCRIAVTGAVFLESGSWIPGGPLPRIRGLTLIARTADDIRVLSSPPWWTRGRRLVVIGVLMAVLAVIAFWCAALRRLAERRGRQLFRAEIDRVSADLRVDERTRLAVELHDSIAQNLTGISLQLAAAKSAKDVDPAGASEHLDTADRMLRSCRTEIRRCIWDLKSEALEDPDFVNAIRRTVLPVSDGAELSIRFAVPRARISDMTAHAVLQIIRELCSNAVRHGKARHLRIAGSAEDGWLRFSVRDDGSGFDTTAAPGSDKGHFGLDGIRERARQLGGTLSIQSAPGAGTRAEVSVRQSATQAQAGK